MRLLSFTFKGRESFGLLKNQADIVEIPPRVGPRGPGLRQWLAAGGDRSLLDVLRC